MSTPSATAGGRLAPRSLGRERLLSSIARVPLVPLVSALGALLIAFRLATYRHQLAPDIFVDELIYAEVGRNLLAGHGLTVQGLPFFWQPPLFFLLEIPAMRLAGTLHAPSLQGVLLLRPLTAFYAALTVAILLLFAWRLRNGWAGWTVALLFSVDPFVLRVTRRLYLEPLAGLLVVSFLWLCYESLGRWTWRRRAGAGVLFGLAVLSKELLIFVFGVLLLLWMRRQVRLAEPIVVGAIGLGIYLLYPMWALAAGQGQPYSQLKLYQFARLVGVYRISGWNRPGVSFVNALLVNLGEFWTSYLAIGLAAAAIPILWFRRDRASIFLSTWGVATFVFFAGLAKFGTLNDQFFYYLMLPVIAIIGHVYGGTLTRMAAFTAGRLREGRRPDGRATPATARNRFESAVRGLGLAWFMAEVSLVVLVPDVLGWAQHFALARDDGWVTLVREIDAQVPRGAVVDIPGTSLEILRFAYPGDEYRLVRTASLQRIRAEGISWFVLDSKDPALANGIDQATYDAIRNAGVERWSTDEHTFQRLSLVQVTDPARLP